MEAIHGKRSVIVFASSVHFCTSVSQLLYSTAPIATTAAIAAMTNVTGEVRNAIAVLSAVVATVVIVSHAYNAMSAAVSAPLPIAATIA